MIKAERRFFPTHDQHLADKGSSFSYRLFQCICDAWLGGRKKKVLHGRKQKSRRSHRALAFCHCTVLPNIRNLTTVPGMPKCYKLCFLPPSGQVFLKSRSFQKSCHTLSCSHWNVYEEKTTGIGDQLFSQKHLLY